MYLGEEDALNSSFGAENGTESDNSSLSSGELPPLPQFTQISCFYMAPILIVLGVIFNAFCFYIFSRMPKNYGDFYIQKIIIIVDICQMGAWIQFIVYFRIIRFLGTPMANMLAMAFGIYMSLFVRDTMYNLVIFMLITSNYERVLALRLPVYFANLNHKARSLKEVGVGFLLAMVVAGYNCLGAYMKYDESIGKYRNKPYYIDGDCNLQVMVRKYWIMIATAIHVLTFAALIVIVAYEAWLFKDFVGKKTGIFGWESAEQQAKRRSESSMTILLLGQSVAVLICASPMLAYNVLSLFIADGRDPMLRNLLAIAMICALFASSTNLPLYYVIGKQFRQQANRLLFKSSNQVSTIDEQLDNYNIPLQQRNYANASGQQQQ